MTQTLRRTIRADGLTAYRIAKDTGVKRQSIDAFLAGRQSLRLDKADLVARYLGLELRRTRRRKGR